MSGKKFYFGTEDGGIIFKTERKIGYVSIDNYVYDLWLPVLGITAIGVYSVYCRLEREGVCKGMTQRRLARMCHIGTSKLSAINTLLQKHQFIRIRMPEKLDILRHLTMEITVMDAPKELSKEVIDAIDGYEPLSPWLMELPETPDGASGSTKRDLDEAPDGDSVFEALCLNPSDVEGNPPAQTSLLGEPSQPELQPNINPSPHPVTEPATPGGQPDSDTITDAKDTLYSAVAPGDHPDDNIPKFQTVPGVTALSEPRDSTASGDASVVVGHRHIHQPVNQSVLDDLPALSVVVGYPDPPTTPDPSVKRNYLAEVFNYANRQQPGDSDTHVRPKYWETVSDDEYAICRRVADLWCGGRLPFPGSIEAHCGAAGWLLHELNSGNLRACIRALDEYHRHYEDEQMSFTVAGPKSLVAVLPAFLAQGGGDGEPGVIRLGG